MSDTLGHRVPARYWSYRVHITHIACIDQAPTLNKCEFLARANTIHLKSLRHRRGIGLRKPRLLCPVAGVRLPSPFPLTQSARVWWTVLLAAVHIGFPDNSVHSLGPVWAGGGALDPGVSSGPEGRSPSLNLLSSCMCGRLRTPRPWPLFFSSLFLSFRFLRLALTVRRASRHIKAVDYS